MTAQNQGFSSNKTLPKMTCPKSDPVISRFQDFALFGELGICLLQVSPKYIYIYMYIVLFLSINIYVFIYIYIGVPVYSLTHERALEYICAARRSVDPSLPPLTDSHIWLKTFSVQESLPFEHLMTSTYQLGCNKQIANLLVTSLCYVEAISMEKMRKIVETHGKT